MLERDGKIGDAVDTHYLGHMVGEKTATTFGSNREAFLLCPMNLFNDGCTHGFFEYVTAQLGSPEKAASEICESFSGTSEKFTVYCYHGIGHGIMMAQTYDLDISLKICDALSARGQRGCWQGVFMENVLANATGKVPSKYLSNTDMFAPCNSVKEKYKWECYINHSGYLMSLFEGSIFKAAEACTENFEYQDVCAQGLGLYVSNPSWIFKTSGITDVDEAVEEAVSICESFPESIVIDCFKGVLGSILNNDWPDINKRAIKLCSKTAKWSKDSCFEQLGREVKRQVSSGEDARSYCNQVPETFIEDCVNGTLKPDSGV
jgi:hypothetical protein